MASTLWSAFIVVMHLIPFFLTAAADLQEISETVRAISGMVTALLIISEKLTTFSLKS